MISKALVVDDDEMILNFLSTLLIKKFGLKVATAKDGYEGLEALRNDKINIVFLDIMMPKMDGVMFLETMRSDKQFDHIPVIVVSAVNQKETIAKLLSLGVKDYILKPLEFLKVTERLNDIFSKYD